MHPVLNVVESSQHREVDMYNGAGHKCYTPCSKLIFSQNVNISWEHWRVWRDLLYTVVIFTD